MRRLWVVVLLVGCGGGHPDKATCEQVVDKMIDIFTAPKVAEGAKAPAEVETATKDWRKQLKEKDRDPTRGALLETCTKEMSTGAAGCVMTAVDEATLAKCFGG